MRSSQETLPPSPFPLPSLRGLEKGCTDVRSLYFPQSDRFLLLVLLPSWQDTAANSQEHIAVGYGQPQQKAAHPTGAWCCYSPVHRSLPRDPCLPAGSTTAGLLRA